jgi:GNAT superfamily N-acetyltransferase
MREIGRLREEAFRDAGGGSGLEMDIDEFDTMENPYQQLIVWDPEAEKILGGYRFILGPDIKLDANRQPLLATSHMFHFTEKFVDEYLPYTIELGRSFVTPEYQSTKVGAKALFALDNLWDGLGALMVKYSDMKYFFGKMTMYPEYNRQARDLIQHFLFKHFEDHEKLVVPMDPIVIETSRDYMDSILNEPEYAEDYKILNTEVRKLGVNIPPLVNAYMGLSSTMKMFGGGINHEFSEAEETCILVTMDDIYEAKKARHVDTYLAQIQ